MEVSQSESRRPSSLIPADVGCTTTERHGRFSFQAEFQCISTAINQEINTGAESLCILLHVYLNRETCSAQAHTPVTCKPVSCLWHCVNCDQWFITDVLQLSTYVNCCWSTMIQRTDTAWSRYNQADGATVMSPIGCSRPVLKAGDECLHHLHLGFKRKLVVIKKNRS